MNDVVERLVTEWDADFSKLSNQLEKMEKKVVAIAGRVETRLKGVNDNAFDKLFSKGDPARALDKVFDSTRLKVLDSGVARIGLFGSAIEELGGAGIAAAAGIAVMAAGLAKAQDAMNFADEISDAATQAQVGVEALQEYRFAILAAGGAEKDADTALKAFSSTLGQAQAGAERSLKWFKALGFTKEQLQGFNSAEDALPKVADAIARLGSEAQKAAFADKLGLGPLLPIIDQGVGAMGRLREEARSLGVVMDEAMVKRAGEAHDKAEVLSKVIDMQLKEAFVGLAPVIVGTLKLMADLAREFADMAASFQDFQDRSDRALIDRKAKLTADVLKIQFTSGNYRGDGKTLAPAAQSLLDAKRQELSQIDAELTKRRASATPAPTTKPGPTVELPKTSTTKTPENKQSDDDREVQHRLEDQLASIKRDMIGVGLSDLSSLEEQAKVHQEQLAADKDEFDRRLKQQAEDFAAKTADQVRRKELSADQAKALIDQNAAANATLQAEHDKLIAAKQTTQAFVDQAAKAKALADATAETLNAQADIEQALAGLAKTLAERRDLELKAIADRHAAEQARLNADLELAQAAGNEAEASRIRSRIAADNAQASIAQESVRRATRGPLEAFNEDAGADKVAQAQQIVVDGLNGFSDALTDALLGAKDFGDALRDVGRSVLRDTTRQIVENGITKPLSGLFLKGLGGLIPQKAADAASGAATGAAIGTAMTAAGAGAATAMGTGITAGGATAATAMGSAIVAAGATAAAAMAAAVASSSAASGGLSSITSALSGAIPKFATGTDFAPGGLALVGERGPELVNLPRGSQVIPNHALNAVQSLNPASLGASVTHVTQEFHFDLKHAVTTPELLAQMSAMAGRAKAEAIATSVDASRRALPGQLRSEQLLRGGG
jgi:hypothetical protein